MKEQVQSDNVTSPGRRATIHDVARRANVSVSTVSRVFNGLNRVSDATRQKVQQAMQELNYSPSIIASSMITGRTKMVLVMVPDFENPYYSMVLDGIDSCLHKFGYYSLVMSYKNYLSDTYLQIQNKFDKVIDGVIALPDNNFQFYQDWCKPCVLVDRYMQGVQMNTVLAANYEGARALTEELVHAGHRKIAIISEETWSSTISDRLNGYLSVLQNHGIPVRKEYIVMNPFSVANGRKGFLELLKLPDPPTAVFAANNLVCIGCIQACQELNLKIGEDISLVGYDDHELAQYVPPGITVISQPAFEMGEQAALDLLDQLNEKSTQPSTKIMGVHLIRRGSVKNLNL